ncbi:uncharacterized protein LOC114797786 isoform X2 [Denticeps clupeoides]|uniref:uncharacterized protein LOC114797786 isoform X2 n=1 Tax=Denticeps clupeoides TaxID=299321 RepID=UPI0010A59E7B|nr:uncharacterized protein LOC114797786 isoform X2 [Denticeps clupeoides]XP_028848703.1 uncharacterized protein LOC114797786 isoform X2 [Denticeps clupeoides]
MKHAPQHRGCVMRRGMLSTRLFLILIGCCISVWYTDASELDVRLVGGDRCSGRVEVQHAGRWVGVCNHAWGVSDAHVVCRDLGCGLASSHGGVSDRLTGPPPLWLSHVKCVGNEARLKRCSHTFSRNCTNHTDVGVHCSRAPILTLPSSYNVFSAGEAVNFICTVLNGHKPVSFHLYKRGTGTPLVTQRVENGQKSVELTLSDLETSHQGSYSCVYSIWGNLLSQLHSSQSNSINIIVVDLHTPQIWYNTSQDTPAGWVFKGSSFNITCTTQPHYPGGSFQLRLIRPNGTVRHSLPALSSSVTFSFPSAQALNEGYYCCLYKVQLGERMFTSRESQPLPVSIRDTDPLLSPMVISLLVSAVTFVIATGIMLISFRMLCRRKKKLAELERESRTCVDNTYVVLTTIK